MSPLLGASQTIANASWQHLSSTVHFSWANCLVGNLGLVQLSQYYKEDLCNKVICQHAPGCTWSAFKARVFLLFIGREDKVERIVVGKRWENDDTMGSPMLALHILYLAFLVGVILLHLCATRCSVMVRSIKSVLPRTVVNIVLKCHST